MLYLRMIACWLEHTRLFDLIGEREREELKKVSQKSASQVPLLGRRGKSLRAKKALHRHRVVVQPLPPHTQRRGQRKASHRMKTISERIFPRCNPLVHLRAVSLPSRARATCILSPPRKKENFGAWGCSEKSRKRTLTMLDRPWRYLSGENPIRLQNPLRIEICFDVRNVNKVSAMCADFHLFFSASAVRNRV